MAGRAANCTAKSTLISTFKLTIEIAIAQDVSVTYTARNAVEGMKHYTSYRYRYKSTSATLELSHDTCACLRKQHAHNAARYLLYSTPWLCNLPHLHKARRNAGNCSHGARGQQGGNARTVTIRYPWRCQSEGVPSVDESWLDQDSRRWKRCSNRLVRAFLPVEVSDTAGRKSRCS